MISNRRQEWAADVQHEQPETVFQDGLRKLMEGKTGFSIAHRLATIRDSSRIMVVNGGVIVEMTRTTSSWPRRGSTTTSS